MPFAYWSTKSAPYHFSRLGQNFTLTREASNMAYRLTMFVRKELLWLTLRIPLFLQVLSRPSC